MAGKQQVREEERSSAGTGNSKKAASILDAIQRLRQEEERDRAKASTMSSQPGAAVASDEIRGYVPASGQVQAAPRHLGTVNLIGPSHHAMAMYSRQLAILVDVGIPLLEALRILSRRGSNRQLAAVSGNLARRLEEGLPLSRAMAEHPRVFSPMFVGVVRSGEAGGILDESLRRLADLLERRSALRTRVISSLWYPAIALLFELIIITIIVVYAMPKLLSAFPDRSQLPGPTRLLLGLSETVSQYWIIVLLLLAAGGYGIWRFVRSAKGRVSLDRWKLRIPGINSLSRKINVAHFARTLGNLTAAGIPLIDAIGITADTADNAVVTPTLYRVRDAVERGEKMDIPMRSEPIFDEVVIDMVMVGDEAGALEGTLLKIADTYDLEVDASLKRMTAILEPILIALLGITVAIIAMAVFLPYFNLIKSPMLMVE